MSSEIESVSAFQHKLNNKLAGILMNISLLGMYYDKKNPESIEIIDDLQQEIIMLNRMIIGYFNLQKPKMNS